MPKFPSPSIPYTATSCTMGNALMKQLEQNESRRPIAADPRVRSVAPEGSVRLKVFYKLLPRISTFFRRRRMMRLVKIIKIKPGMRVLDLGGTPTIWEHVSVPLEIMLLNLPGAISLGMSASLQSPRLRHHTFHAVEGDACNVIQFSDHSFDLVFSNSVIEHVGPPPMQAKFAHEVICLVGPTGCRRPQVVSHRGCIQECLSTGSTRDGCGQHCLETGGNGFQNGGGAIWAQPEFCRDAKCPNVFERPNACRLLLRTSRNPTCRISPGNDHCPILAKAKAHTPSHCCAAMNSPRTVAPKATVS